MRVERRADGAVELDGYVNAVERDSSLMRGSRGPFVERVAAGAFERTLERGEDVELRFNHARLLGTRNNRDVELWEDAIGLRAKAVVTDAEVEARAVAGGTARGGVPLPPPPGGAGGPLFGRGARGFFITPPAEPHQRPRGGQDLRPGGWHRRYADLLRPGGLLLRHLQYRLLR